MKLTLILFVLCFFVVAGCRTTDTSQKVTNTGTVPAGQQSPVPGQASPAASPNQLGQQPATQATPKIDACALLTSKDIESVQGETVKETKLTGASAGGFNVSQCYFALPTVTNSVSLAIAQKAEGPGARDPKEFWKETFHEEKERGKREDREKEEEEESGPPQKVAGVGDEAFWMAGRVAGALYVLKGNRYIRVSVGGAGDQQSKIKKSKALATKVLERL